MLIEEVGTRDLPEFMSALIGTWSLSPHIIFCLNVLESGSFHVQHQYTGFHASRTLRDFNHLHWFVAAILLHNSIREFHPTQPIDGIPPGTFAICYMGFLFGCQLEVVVICSYLTLSTSEAFAVYREAFWRTQCVLLSDYIVPFRMAFEVLLLAIPQELSSL